MTADKQNLVSAIQGPVLMITVGTLFALDRYSIFPFHQTWPVILIVLGLLNLSRWTNRGQHP